MARRETKTCASKPGEKGLECAIRTAQGRRAAARGGRRRPRGPALARRDRDHRQADRGRPRCLGERPGCGRAGSGRAAPAGHARRPSDGPVEDRLRGAQLPRPLPRDRVGAAGAPAHLREVQLVPRGARLRHRVARRAHEPGGLGGRAGGGDRPPDQGGERVGGARGRLRLYGRERRQRTRPPVLGSAVGAREEPRHVLPGRPRGRHTRRVRRPAGQAPGRPRQRRDHAGLDDRRDDLRRRRDRELPVARLHARAGRPDPHRNTVGRGRVPRPTHLLGARRHRGDRGRGRRSAHQRSREEHDMSISDRAARAAMEEHDLGGLIMFVGENIRYVTGTFQGNWKHNIFIRYAVLPRDGDPVLFETVGSDLECSKLDAPWLNGNIRPAYTWRWAEGAEPMMVGRMADSVVDVLKEAGVENEQIGIDTADMSAMQAFQERGLNLVNAWPAMSAARRIKTPDEIELLKISSSLGDAAMWKIQNEWLKPGIREADITAKVNEFFYAEGADFVYDIIVASGGNTSPYRRWHTDKLIRQGDLVIVDINAVGPGGYFIDFVRCFLVDAEPTDEIKGLYRECHDSLYDALAELKPGNTTADVASKFPEYDDDRYGSVSLQQFAHSIGLSLYEGMWVSRAYSLDYPAEIEENMYFAIETFAGHPGLQQTVRLEENVLVGPDGPVIFTLHPMDQRMLTGASRSTPTSRARAPSSPAG